VAEVAKVAVIATNLAGEQGLKLIRPRFLLHADGPGVGANGRFSRPSPHPRRGFEGRKPRLSITSMIAAARHAGGCVLIT
jgi:hypothetical protein